MGMIVVEGEGRWEWDGMVYENRGDGVRGSGCKIDWEL